MNDWRYFHCTEGSSNKYWQCRILPDHSVEKKWGRVGGHEDTQTKTFSSAFDAQKYVDKEVDKRFRKGYQEKSIDDIEEATEVAKVLGTRWKIDRIEFLSESWDSIDNITVEISDEYYDSFGVYVEILNSWSKDKIHMLLNKSHAIYFRNGNLSDTHVNLSGLYGGPDNFESGVRLSIAKLQSALNTISRGDMGFVRPQASSISSQIGFNISDQVVAKFASSTGARTLSL